MILFLLVSDVWNFYLPYLYSCISLLGVVSLLSEYAHDFVPIHMHAVSDL